MLTRRGLLDVSGTVAIAVVIFLTTQTFVVQPFRVEGASMEPTLLEDQHVLIDKLTPRWSGYARGDIVVIDQSTGGPPGTRAAIIKRVIAVAGDRIQLEGGVVYVNGVPVLEPYIYSSGAGQLGTSPTQGHPSEWLIDQGEVFVMGDHRGDSMDSRTIGPIPVSMVIGRAWLRYWPLEEVADLPKEPESRRAVTNRLSLDQLRGSVAGG